MKSLRLSPTADGNDLHQRDVPRICQREAPILAGRKQQRRLGLEKTDAQTRKEYVQGIPTTTQGAGWTIEKAPRMSPVSNPRARSSGYRASSLAATSGAMPAPWHTVHTGCVPMAFM